MSAAFGRVAAAVVCLLVSLSGAVPAGAAPRALRWGPCPERPDDAAVRCASIRLPVDWANPGGAGFTLALAMRPANGSAPHPGPLVMHPGGPGASGVDAVLHAEQWFSPDLLGRFDLVGFDPRGVARSAPVRCSADLVDRQPFPIPATEREFRDLRAHNARLGRDCAQHTGPVSGHLDATSVARDIDAIRAALGAERISYYGLSYGTLVGERYAELFPHRVRAMALDGVMDHSLDTGEFLRTQSAGVEDGFREFVAWCDRSSTCALHGRDVAAAWDELVRRADAGELPGPDGAPLSWWELSQSAAAAFSGPHWAEFARDIADALAAPPSARAASELLPDPLAVACQDWSFPVTGAAELARYDQRNRVVAPHVRGAALPWLLVSMCQGWPAPVRNPQHPLRVRTDLPVLLLNAVHDPQTPLSWARHVAGQLGERGRLVTYRGWGHHAYGRNACTTGAVDRYLIDRLVPPTGSDCPATGEDR
ncbi:alpha/beta hydrolase [Saccharopolyspora rosea]|uniref:Alpha/beta hydrolase n=1 Tax=Saccharopolyspora rosea TaxID=524884 RepID=A0ABW3FSN4_9PSEU